MVSQGRRKEKHKGHNPTDAKKREGLSRTKQGREEIKRVIPSVEREEGKSQECFSCKCFKEVKGRGKEVGLNASLKETSNKMAARG